MGKAAQSIRQDRELEPATMRGVTRTLAVVRALNENNGVRVSELARLTRIPRPSLYRILDALCSLGYLRRTDEERYELTLLVRTLSDGFSDEPWVRAIAHPIMEELQRDIVWPTDLATFYGNAMYLRATTRRHSPLTIDAATVGLRLPMLPSATGRAYLAFCTDAEPRGNSREPAPIEGTGRPACARRELCPRARRHDPQEGVRRTTPPNL